MMASPVIAAVVALIISASAGDALPAAAPFLLVWALAPAVAYWLSLPVGPRERPLTDASERCCAGRRARRGGTSKRS